MSIYDVCMHDNVYIHVCMCICIYTHRYTDTYFYTRVPMKIQLRNTYMHAWTYIHRQRLAAFGAVDQHKEVHFFTDTRTPTNAGLSAIIYVHTTAPTQTD